MRAIDRLECAALGRTPREALRLGLRTSYHCWTALVDDRPQAMMGAVYTSLLTGTGTVWMLGTDSVYTAGRALLKLGPIILAAMMQDFRLLENIVSTRNDKAIRLLRRWGAHVGGEVETYRGVDFIPFRMERSIQGERSAA